MAKVCRNLGKRPGATIDRVSSYPSSSCIKSLHLGNASSFMLIVLGVTMIAKVHGTLGDDSHGINPTHPHRHPHHQNYLAEGDIEVVDKTVYECPDMNYPKELEVFMNRLTTEMGKEDEEFGQTIVANSDGNTSSCSSSTSSSTDRGTLWSPNPKLFGKREIRTQYRICQRHFICPADRIKEYHWHPILYDGKNFPNGPTHSSNYQLSNMTLMKGGYLSWNKAEWERRVYSKEEFCISRRGDGGWLTFKTCASNNCSDPKLRPACVRKCCPPTQVIGEETRGCIPAHPSWRPIFYRSASELLAPNASIIVGFPNCAKKYVIRKYVMNATPIQHFKLLLNGSLVQIDGSKQTFLNNGKFCIDGIFYGKINTELSRNGLPIKYSRSEWDQVVIACIPTPINYRFEIDKWRIPLYTSLNCVSALFLLVTDIVYLLLARHQNIQGWLQFAYATSLFVSFNCFVIVQLWSNELSAISESLCKFMGYMNHLAYLSSFFWLTSMSFDLWRRFSRPLRNSRARELKGFLGFAAFSIGIPLLISITGMTLDNVYGELLLEPPFILPGVGTGKCYFEDKRSQIPYLYAPAGVTLLVDIIFFTSTMLHLRKRRGGDSATGNGLVRTDNENKSTLESKEGLRVIGKLLVLMGVLWIFELGSWLAHIWFPDEEILLIYAFLPFDVLNCLQGVVISIIIICGPTVGKHVMAWFRRDDDADAGKTCWNDNCPAQQPTGARVNRPLIQDDKDYIETEIQ